MNVESMADRAGKTVDCRVPECFPQETTLACMEDEYLLAPLLVHFSAASRALRVLAVAHCLCTQSLGVILSYLGDSRDATCHVRTWQSKIANMAEVGRVWVHSDSTCSSTDI